MQRFVTIFLVLTAALGLYGSAHAFSSQLEDAPAINKDKAATGAVPAATTNTTTGTPILAAPAPLPLRHIALLLPLKSQPFGRAAEVVRQGFMAAADREQGTLPVKVYPTSDDVLDILTAYQQALDAGAAMVVGPLTRNGVSALAASNLVKVPTLTLNTAEGEANTPPNMYLFGLQVEVEARQAARLATIENRKHAFIINDGGALSLRLQAAFTDEWLKLGGALASANALKFDNEPSTLVKLRGRTTGDNNLVFLALDAAKSRMLRSYLDPSTPVYATSQIFSHSSDSLLNHDFNEVRFLDMPWLLQPDHPAVITYRRAEVPMNADLERLYALGIDAFRLANLVLKPHQPGNIALDGVTGRISLVAPRQFVREPVAARFYQGEVQLLDVAR